MYTISTDDQEKLLNRIAHAGQQLKQDGWDRLDILVFVHKELEKIQETVPLANQTPFRQMVRKKALAEN